MPLELPDILEIADGLHQDFETLREDAERRKELYSMRRDPYVPSEIAREGTFQFKSPLLIDAAKAIRSDIMMNPTEFTVLPLARERDKTIPRAAEAKAENLERALAVIWSRLNNGRRLDSDVIFNQLILPYAVLLLEFHSLEIPEQPEWMDDAGYANLVAQLEAEFVPWKVTQPDPLTCSWIEQDGKPIIFSRRYKMLVRDIESAYSRNRGSIRPESYLRLVGETHGDMYGSERTEYHWDWVSDDYDRNTSEIKAGFQEVEVVWLDDGDYIYHAVLNPGTNSGGELLWRQPNPIGRVTAFVVPGNTTPARRPEDRYEPFLLPLMQIVMQLNDIRSTRATAARNLAGPHTYIAIDPEIAKIYLTRGVPLPDSVKWSRNETHYLLGKMEAAPSELSVDWDKLEGQIHEELQRYLPSPFVHIVDPAVLKAATATSILHAAETGLRLYGPLMASYDVVIHDIMEAIVTSVKLVYPDLDISVFATGEERANGVNLKKGAVYRFSAKDVDFAYRLLVKTRGMSQAQAAAQFDLALRQWVLPDGSPGPITWDGVAEAANYTDVVAQKMRKAQELMLNAIDPWLQMLAQQKAQEVLRIETGMEIPLGPPPAGAGGGGRTPSRIPNAAQRMDSPQITAPEGGSESTNLGAGAG